MFQSSGRDPAPRPQRGPGRPGRRLWAAAAALGLFAGCGTPDRPEPEERAASDGASGLSAAVVTDLPEVRWEAGPSLPRPLANNAVTAAAREGRLHLFSFLGLDSTRTRAGIVRDAYHLDPALGRWRTLPPVPGEEGRLAATAEAVDGRVFLFGGYTVAPDGSEKSLPNVDVWDPGTEEWLAAAPMPLPVDDAVSGVWRDSLIFLVSGWHDRDNVSDVQVYDPAADRWLSATPIPGAPVFGHAGGVVGDAIVYCDGVTVDRSRDPAFRITDACWRGEIDPARPRRISWSPLPPHPGPPLYRAAAGPWEGRGLLVFAGGTENPYNYDGIGYDGVPSEPVGRVFAYDPAADRWIHGPPKPVRTMDHRGLAGGRGELWVIGGMTTGRRVTARTSRLVWESGSAGETPP